MSGISYSMPRFQAIDQSGRPMVGATLYTYKNKTTSPAPTWRDKEQSAYNTNPIVLDGRGEAVIWLDPEQVYTFVLRDWAGTLVWTQNDVSSGASGVDLYQLINRLNDPTGNPNNGSGMVSYDETASYQKGSIGAAVKKLPFRVEAEADRSKVEADRARTEADRAKAEAISARDAVQYKYLTNDNQTLSAISGMTEGDRAYVRSSGHVWVYLNSTWSDMGPSPTKQLHREMMLTEHRANGITEIFRNSNIFRDDYYNIFERPNGSVNQNIYKGSGDSTTTVVEQNGRLAISTTSSANGGYVMLFFRIDYLDLSFGDSVSFSARCLDSESRTAQIFMSQYKSGTGGWPSAATEISGTRVTSRVVPNNPAPTDLSVSSVISSDAEWLGFCLRAEQTNQTVAFTDLMVAHGTVEDFRPSVYAFKEEVKTEVKEDPSYFSNNKFSGLSADAVDKPNLFDISSFEFTTISPLRESQGLSSSVFNGEKAWRIAYERVAGGPSNCRASMGPFNREDIGDTVSASVRVLSVSQSPGGSFRVLLMQRDAAASEISSARKTVTLGANGEGVGEEFVTFSGVPLHPDCKTVELYIDLLTPVGSSREAFFRDMLVCSGNLPEWRMPKSLNTTDHSRVVFVSKDGSDSNLGTKANPLATLNEALNKLSGDGTVYLMSGDYGSEQRINPELVKGEINLIGVRPDSQVGVYDFPLIRMSSPISGITKTAGRSKVYQATVSGLPSLTNFQWAYQDGVADPRTLIDIEDRSPQHRGRTHRLMNMARLMKTTATTLPDALAEIDATTEPCAFVDNGILYFSIVGGGDGTSAKIYLDASSGLISSARMGSCGVLNITGLEVRYGGVNLRPFAKSHVDELSAFGARTNVVDYNILSFGTLEAACGGSRQENTGDGLNGHQGAVITSGNDLYSHDNNDDGYSGHEGCTTRMLGGGLVEYNGGTGLAPAYGEDHVSRGFVSRRNQQKGTRKPGAFAVVGGPEDGGPPDNGVDTLAWFFDCIDIESKTSFIDGHASPKNIKAVCVNCKSIKPEVMGFNVSKVIDCGYIPSSTSSAKASTTEVLNTEPIR